MMRLHTPVWVLAFVFPFFVFDHADYSFSMFLSRAACLKSQVRRHLRASTASMHTQRAHTSPPSRPPEVHTVHRDVHIPQDPPFHCFCRQAQRSAGQRVCLTDECHLHWQMQRPNEDVSLLWVNVPHRASVISVQLQGIGKRSTAFISLAVFNRVGAGFILQHCGATELWLRINRQSLHHCQLLVWLSWASESCHEPMPTPDWFMMAWMCLYFCS